MTVETKGVPAKICKFCGCVSLPPRYLCGNCGKDRLADTDIPGQGRVYCYTIIRVAPPAFQGQAPYCVLVVELGPGLRVSARLAGDNLDEVEIGQNVALDRIDAAGYWFRPVRPGILSSASA